MSRIFNPDWLNELKSRCDIVDVVSRYVPLKRAGREFCGCCPFHHEKTGSFFVYPDTQSYHCFGCKASGDVIKFVQMYDNLSFLDSVEKLSNMVNLPMPQLQGVNKDEIAKKKQERDQILGALKEAAIFYHKNLYSKNEYAQVALQYINKRQIKPEFVSKFGLGVSLDYYSLITYLQSKGYSREILQKAGLLSQVDGRSYDAFGKRLIFPIINKDGQVLGFSARLLENKDMAKYKNTTATPVFNKSEIIFAINLLEKHRKEVRDAGQNFTGFENIIIVEGQIDVISMHQYGFNNAVACLGTALTPMHSRRLKQFTENIILLLDGDGAGQKATLRSIDVLRDTSLNVKVASLPNGQDPDEFLKANGSEAMKEILNQAIDGIEYKIKVLAERYDLSDLNQKSKFVREALVVIKGLETQSLQDIYLESVHKYCGTPIDIMRIDLKNIPDNAKPLWEREEQPEEQPQNVEEVAKDGYTPADVYILASILYNKEYALNIEEIRGLIFVDEGLKEAYEYIISSLDKSIRPNIGGLYSYMEVDKSTPALKQVANYEFLKEEYPEIIYKTYILKNKERVLKLQNDKMQALCVSTQDKEERNRAMQECMNIAKKLSQIREDIETLNTEYAYKQNFMNKRKR